jgi:hypothetical protein
MLRRRRSSDINTSVNWPDHYNLSGNSPSLFSGHSPALVALEKAEMAWNAYIYSLLWKACS